MIALFAIVVGSYFIGSIPSGYLAGRLGGIDIRKVGSGNIGATNVTRALGKRFGYAVFAADFSKGLAAVLCAKLIARHVGEWWYNEEIFPIAAAVFCVIGNAFPVWLGFRGGKGVAVSAGVIFALMPLAAAVVTLIWFVTFQVTRYVSLASMIGALALPVIVLVMLHFGLMNQFFLFYVALGLTGIVILRHRSNLSRLMRGTERRFHRSGD
ncbi:MAG: acyl phosphate:glycerol-3-phosphate acyltransferase [Verrucomicrobiota bacterium]